ncbi:MAG: AAA family ATPase [Bacteroidales bacterium]|nr:AAA family ATPase [Bacteroidales bacterium]
MRKIEIHNFGPIKEAFIEVKKVTVFMGNQGSGKSTAAKLISTFAWIEKFVFKHRVRKVWAPDNLAGNLLSIINNDFIKYLGYHRIESYLKYDTEIIYFGGYFRIAYRKGTITFHRYGVDYLLPKITYFPAERNFISSIKKSKESNGFKLWSQSLQEFKEFFQEAKENMKHGTTIQLPISGTSIEYNQHNDIMYVKGEDYKIPLSDSASGFQSFVPMYVVAEYLSKITEREQEMDNSEREIFIKQSTEILNNPIFTKEQKNILLSQLASIFNIQSVFNIIEEPEQNLFPSSQRNMLFELLKFNNASADNCMIITTHSPYIIGNMTLAIKAAELYNKTTDNDVKQKIAKIVPESSAINADDVAIYEFDDKTHTIRELERQNGLPSDNDYLNNALGDTNDLFCDLLDLEEQCRK